MKQEKTLPIWNDLPVVLNVRSSRGITQFSRELLFRSILSSGIDIDRAVDIVHKTEKRLLSENPETITSHQIRNIVYDLLTGMYGYDIAERYCAWRKFQDDKRPFILFLCGAPGIGTDVLASSVAYRFGIQNIVNVDTVAGLFARKSDSTRRAPHPLFAFLTLKEGKKRGAMSPDNVEIRFRERANQSLPGIQRALRFAIHTNINTVFFGSSLIPGLLDIRKVQNGAVVMTVVIGVKNKIEFRSRLKYFVRDHINMEGVRILWTIHHVLTSAAAHNNVPIIHKLNFDASIVKIVQLCSDYLINRMSENRLLDDAIGNLRTILAEVHTTVPRSSF